MTKIQIELPDATVKAASDAGLLTPHALDQLLADAIRRRQAADSLLLIDDRVAVLSRPSQQSGTCAILIEIVGTSSAMTPRVLLLLRNLPSTQIPKPGMAAA